MWGITGSITDSIKKAPRALAEGIADVILMPPEKMQMLWDELSPEDQELFKKAFLAAARLGAKALISYAEKDR